MEFVNLFTGQTIQTQAWQEALSPGSYYAIDNPGVGVLSGNATDFFGVIDGLTVYGEIISAEDCDEGFLLAKAYSAACPEGELGMMHVSQASRQISRVEFELAREAGWIPDYCDDCRGPSNDLAGVGKRNEKNGTYPRYICRDCRKAQRLCETCGTPKSSHNFAYHLCIPSRRRKAGQA